MAWRSARGFACRERLDVGIRSAQILAQLGQPPGDEGSPGRRGSAPATADLAFSAGKFGIGVGLESLTIGLGLFCGVAVQAGLPWTKAPRVAGGAPAGQSADKGPRLLGCRGDRIPRPGGLCGEIGVRRNAAAKSLSSRALSATSGPGTRACSGPCRLSASSRCRKRSVVAVRACSGPLVENSFSTPRNSENSSIMKGCR